MDKKMGDNRNHFSATVRRTFIHITPYVQSTCRRLPHVTVQESLLLQKDRKLRPELYQYIRG